jgi:hypothetical protein
MKALLSPVFYCASRGSCGLRCAVLCELRVYVILQGVTAAMVMADPEQKQPSAARSQLLQKKPLRTAAAAVLQHKSCGKPKPTRCRETCAPLLTMCEGRSCCGAPVRLCLLTRSARVLLRKLRSVFGERPAQQTTKMQFGVP